MRPTFSAVITLLLSIILVGIPLTFFIISIVGQASDAYTTLSDNLDEFMGAGYLNWTLLDRVNTWFTEHFNGQQFSSNDILSTASNFVGTISSFLIVNVGNILKHISVFALHAIVFLLATFYFIRDGEKIVGYLRSLLPLSSEYCDELFGKMYDLMHSIIFGIFGAAVVQGFLAGAAFYFAGISNAAFWGTIAAIMSPIPYIGTATVWVPIAIYLFSTGHFVAGLFVSIWCLVIVGLSDNVAKPYIIGSTTSLHPFAVMVVILGGAFAFGFAGLVFGPFILTITLAFLHIYQLEYKDVLLLPKKAKEPVRAKKKK